MKGLSIVLVVFVAAAVVGLTPTTAVPLGVTAALAALVAALLAAALVPDGVRHQVERLDLAGIHRVGFGVAGFRLIWRKVGGAGRIERAGLALEGRRRGSPTRLAWWWRVPAG